MTHITYKTAKRIKEFLGGSAPEPIGTGILDPKVPRYQLHDLLSKGFCDALAKKLASKEYEGNYTEGFCAGLSGNINAAYYFGGLPAVEKALTEMMGEK